MDPLKAVAAHAAIRDADLAPLAQPRALLIAAARVAPVPKKTVTNAGPGASPLVRGLPAPGSSAVAQGSGYETRADVRAFMD